MGTAEGTPTYGWSCTFLFRATPRRDPNRTLFVRKPTSETTPAAGTSGATPPGPRDATDQPRRLPKVSSRHIGDRALAALAAGYGTTCCSGDCAVLDRCFGENAGVAGA